MEKVLLVYPHKKSLSRREREEGIYEMMEEIVEGLLPYSVYMCLMSFYKNYLN